MKKLLFTLSFLLYMIPAAINAETTPSTKDAADCRVTCTIYVNIGGVTYGFSGTAGGIFTDCATAGDKACQAAMENMLEIIYQL